MEPAAHFTGLIDEVRLSNIARTEEEIRQLMNKGLGLVLAVDVEGKLATAWGAVKFSISIADLQGICPRRMSYMLKTLGRMASPGERRAVNPGV